MSSQASDLQPPHIERIVTALEDAIRSGRFGDSYWLPTERALAEEFRISRTRVRQAIEELERRNLVVREAGCRTAIRRNVEPGGRATTSRRSIALWIPNEPQHSGAQMIARGVQRALDAHTYRLILASPAGATHAEDVTSEAEALAQMAQDDDIAGAILWYNGGSANHIHLQALRARRMPLVFVDRLPPKGFEADYVGVDNRSASQEAVEHLIELGHVNIAHVTNTEPVSTVQDRLEGYQQALLRARIRVRPECVLVGGVQGLADDGWGADELADRLLHLPECPTALFAATDYLAMAMATALQSRQIRVPEDIAVVGFDDIERWLPGKPMLTTIHQPFERMGREAARLMLARLRSARPAAYQHTVLDAPLIVRGSTVKSSVSASSAAPPRATVHT